MPTLDREEALELLDRVKTAMHEQHDNPARLEQLDAHVATVAMVVEHLYDETERAAG